MLCRLGFDASSHSLAGCAENFEELEGDGAEQGGPGQL